MGPKPFWDGRFLRQLPDVAHAFIQRVDARLVVFFVPAQQIPALPELLQAVGVQDEGVRLVTPKTLVGDFDGLPVTHGVHDDRKPFLAGGDILEEDPVAHVGTLVQQVVHGQGLQQSLPDTVALQVIGVGNIVSQNSVALDLDPEGLQDGLPVVVESPLVQLLSRIVERAPEERKRRGVRPLPGDRGRGPLFLPCVLEKGDEYQDACRAAHDNDEQVPDQHTSRHVAKIMLFRRTGWCRWRAYRSAKSGIERVH